MACRRFGAALTAPLAEAGISVFVISTFDTDYLLVKAKNLERGVDIVRRADSCRSPSDAGVRPPG
jgi:hypothetical protein